MSDNPWGSSSSSGNAGARGREWDVLEKVVTASLDEQRRARRWGVFFKSLTFLYLLVILFLVMGRGGVETSGLAAKHTAVVDVRGEIADGGEASAGPIIEGLGAAFAASGSQAVVLRINSPGGSPVQSAYIYDEIRRLRGLHPDKKLYAVIGDVGASGAYYIASAADQIYVNQGSLVGSIGVIMQGFGVEGLMQKLGVEDRTMTAGENKAIMSPFLPVRPEDQMHIKGLLDDIHQQFISAVKQGRGQRLQENPDIFSGLFWTGQRSVELGLADGFGTVESVARTVVKAEKVVDYSVMPDPLSSILKRLGTSMGHAVADRLAPSATSLR
ncbi:MAG: S49 family peptidase [Moraxellaceae bacterium]|nr:S49 family peptidase [Moraxellaceae bacterium]